YLTKELVQREDMYLFEKQGQDYRVSEKDYKGVRDQLISQRVNGGFPYIEVVDGDYLHNGYLYLVHRYEGIELDLKYLEYVLPYLYQLWGRNVYVETVVEEKTVLYSYDGNKVNRRFT